MQTIFDLNVYQPLDGVYHMQDATGVCATLIVGAERALLVDTCTGYADLKAAVGALTGKPCIVCNTHAHLDHIGGNYQFDRVYLNPKDFAVGRLYLGGLDIRPAALAHFTQMGLAPGQTRTEQYLAYHMENVEALNMEQEIDLGGVHVRPVPMGSHSPGMTGFFVRERKLLLGGDSVCLLACLNFPEASSVEQHLQMLKDISAIDFSFLLSSHSKELLTREDLEAMLECAQSYDEAKTSRYADPFYPQFGGRMYLHESQKGKHAIVVAKRSIETHAKDHKA